MKNSDLNSRKAPKRCKRLTRRLRLAFIPLEPRQLLAGDLFSNATNLQLADDSIVQTRVQIESKTVCEETHEDLDNHTCKEDIGTLSPGTITLNDFTFDGDINTFNFFSTGDRTGIPDNTNPDAATNETTNTNTTNSTPIVQSGSVITRYSETENSVGYNWRVTNPDTSQAFVSPSTLNGKASIETANPLESTTISFSSGFEWNNPHASLRLEVHHQNYFSNTQGSNHDALKLAQRTGVIDHYQTFSVIDIESAVTSSTTSIEKPDSIEFDSSTAMKLLAKIERFNPSPIEFLESKTESLDGLPAQQIPEQLASKPTESTLKLNPISLVVLEATPNPESGWESGTPETANSQQAADEIAARIDSEASELGDPIPLIETAAVVAFLVANFPHQNENQNQEANTYRKSW